MSTWHPIEDLEVSSELLASEELTSLARLWTEQRTELDHRGLLDEFTARLQREWAIETGILERLYDIDRGVTRLLIEHGISEDIIGHEGSDRDPVAVAQILRDHADVAEGLLDFVSGERQLTTSYVKELHAALTRSQATCEAVDQVGRLFEVELLHGEYKRKPNNPTRPDGTVHEYCPVEQVGPEMDRLLEFHSRHLAADVGPEVEAAFLHHRFAQIHPFQDGNGRVARALAALVFLRAGWFPPVIRRDDRSQYLEALESADEGGLSDLVELLVRVQKRSLIQALSVSDSVQRADRASDVVALIGKKAGERRAETHDAAASLAASLQAQALERFRAISADLEAAVGGGEFSFFADGDGGDDAKKHWFRLQVIETAGELDYFADLNAFHRWARLVLRNGERTEVLLSLHGVGRFNPSAVGASVCLFRKDDDGTMVGPWTMSNDLFLAESGEASAEVEGRFRRWLEDALVVGLEEWRQASGLV